VECIGAKVEAVASHGAKRTDREIFRARALAAKFRLDVDLAALPVSDSENLWERVGLNVFGSFSSNF